MLNINFSRSKSLSGLLLASLLAFAFVGCDKEEDTGINSADTNSEIGPNLPPAPPYVPSMAWALKADNLDFGSVNVGEKVLKYIEIENSSKDTIKDLKVLQKAGSGFKVVIPSACSELSPGAKCNVIVKFSPKMGSQLFESLKINFAIAGKKYNKDVSVSASAKDEDSISVFNSSNIFGAKLAQMNQKGRLTLTVEKSSGSFEASDIDVKANPLFALDAGSSTCSGTVLIAGTTCTLVLETNAPILANTLISENIEISYKINKVEKLLNTTLDGSFNIVDLLIPATVNFGTLTLPANTTHNLTIKVKNPVGSSISNAQKLKITGLPTNIGLDTNAAASTCLGKTLTPGNDCDFVLKLKATAGKVDSSILVNYTVPGGAETKVPVQIKGDVNVMPLGQYVVVTGQNFGAKTYNPGGTFDVEIEVNNSGAATDIAKNFSFEMRDKAHKATVVNWLPAFFVQIDNAKTTCNNAKTIIGGQSCKLVLTFTPSKTPTNNIETPFAVKYVNGANAPKEVIFDVKGSWAQAAVKPPFLSDAIVGQAFPYYNRAYKRFSAFMPSLQKNISGTTYLVWRPNHGIIHGMRKAGLARDTIELLSSGVPVHYMSLWIQDYTTPTSLNYNKDFTDQLVFAALMMRTGRSTEDNTWYQEDTARSAKYLKKEAPATGLFPRQQDIDDFVFALETIGDTSKCYDNIGTATHPNLQYTAARGCNINRLYIYNFLYGVHHMDLRRMAGYDKNQLLEKMATYLMLPGKNDPLVLKLWKRSGQYLKLTGDHDLDDFTSPPQGAPKDIFYILSLDPVKLRQEIEKLQHTPF